MVAIGASSLIMRYLKHGIRTNKYYFRDLYAAAKPPVDTVYLVSERKVGNLGTCTFLIKVQSFRYQIVTCTQITGLLANKVILGQTLFNKIYC